MNKKNNLKINTEINIFSENIHQNLKIDEKKAIEIAKAVFKYYLNDEYIFEKSCLVNESFDCISFDILYCDNEKTHEINKEYREKDYPADIITFAIFADSDEKFVFDNEINLGEIIISLDKINENTKEKIKGINSKDSYASTRPRILSSEENNELYFLISHGIMHLLGFDHQTNEDYNFIVNAQNSALKEAGGRA